MPKVFIGCLYLGVKEGMIAAQLDDNCFLDSIFSLKSSLDKRFFILLRPKVSLLSLPGEFLQKRGAVY